MRIGRDVVVTAMVTFCFTAMVFMVIPLQAANHPYNPWIDSNDDGNIGLQDLVLLANSYGTNGTPLQKASVQYDSGWLDITNMCGQNITLTHNLNNTNINSTGIMVGIQGKIIPNGGTHQKYLGLTMNMPAWSKTYHMTSDDFVDSMIQTKDGGYVLAGAAVNATTYTNIGCLVEIDANGVMLWNQTYGGGGPALFADIIEANDGGYAITGYAPSSGAGSDFWLVKTDADGNMQWNQTYGGPNDDLGYSLIQTSDGGYVVAGYTNSSGATGGDLWLVKTDSAGNLQWNQTYGGTGMDFGYSLIQTADGGYAIAGYTSSFGAGNDDFWLVKTDADGIMQWNKTYGGANYEEAYSVVQTSDGGYALAGRTRSFGAGIYDAWLVKTDPNGIMQWNQTYGGSRWDSAQSIIQTSEGGYAFAGFTDFGVGHVRHSWLVKTDANGNIQWSRTYSVTSDDSASCVIQTKDGGFALAGITQLTDTSGGWQMYFLKSDVESGVAWIDSTANTLTLYRGATDAYWNYVRVQIWQRKTP